MDACARCGHPIDTKEEHIVLTMQTIKVLSAETVPCGRIDATVDVIESDILVSFHESCVGTDRQAAHDWIEDVDRREEAIASMVDVPDSPEGL